jgi:hypothetical protein
LLHGQLEAVYNDAARKLTKTGSERSQIKVSVKMHQSRGYWYVDTIWPDGIRTRDKMTD